MTSPQQPTPEALEAAKERFGLLGTRNYTDSALWGMAYHFDRYAAQRVTAAEQERDRLAGANKRMADDLSEWHEIAGMVQEALGAAPNDPATWIVPMNFDTAIRKALAAATDKARREALLECAEIAKKYRTEAELERHKTDDSEGKECWLWAFDTSNAIERDIRALTPQNPGDAEAQEGEKT